MFLTVMTVAEALAALTPVRRSAVVPAAPALGVVPARDVTTLERLPAWPRATVDGYAVRAADTYAASETLPAFLEVTGTVAMAREPDGEVGRGGAAGRRARACEAAAARRGPRAARGCGRDGAPRARAPARGHRVDGRRGRAAGHGGAPARRGARRLRARTGRAGARGGGGAGTARGRARRNR